MTTGFIKRFLRHMAMTPYTARRCFSPADLDAIHQAVAEGEKRHRGEVRFVVEAELTTQQLWSGMRARARAIEVFSMLQVWNTEENTGVLVYVLLADRNVEIIADRGIQKKVDAAQWVAICKAMDEHFANERYRDGAIHGVTAVAELLATHFPATEANVNELPDRPVMM